MFNSRKSNSLITTLFIPTYVRIMLSDWTNLNRFVIEHARPMKEKINPSENQQNHIATEEQLNDALNGPYNSFIQQCLAAFAKIARIRIEQTTKQSDFFTAAATLTNPSQIPERMLKQVTVAECDNLSKQLNDEVASYIQQWRDSAQQWIGQVTQEILKQDLKLSEIEVNELSDDEPISDIMNRFTELKIDQPKLPKQMSFTAYYKLKATLAIQSVLSRMQQPHDSNVIDKHLKPLKKLFEQIDQEQKTLLESQQAQITEIIAPVDYVEEKPKEKTKA